MITLKAIGVDGTIRRCDAKCYNAKGKKCHCICGGVNHSRGEEQAIYKSLIFEQSQLDECKLYRLEKQRKMQLQLFERHDELLKLAIIGKD